MTKWIRWSGLLGFVVLIGLVVAFWMFAAAPLIKFSIEKFGSEAAGAKVDVEEVVLGFNPLLLSINGVQVADKDAPMTNVLSIKSSVADLALFPLLLGKTIIHDMSLQGVEFGSPRKTSGALAVEAEKTNKEASEKNAVAASNNATDTSASGSEQSLSASKALPSADEIIAREPLLTVTRGEKFKSSLDTHKKEINESLAQVPNKAAFAEYQQQLDLILKGKFKSIDDFKQRKKAFDALKSQFKTDRKAIKRAANAIKAGKKDLKSQWSGLKNAPQEDYDNIKGKYTLDAAGTSNLAALLFGKEAGGYADQALGYYEMVSPLLASDDEKNQLALDAKRKRLSGEYIHFPTDHPLPDFWIKKLSFSASLMLGDVAVTVNNITHQQDVINKATTLVATGQDMPTIKSLRLEGTLDHRTGAGRDQFDLNIKDWKLLGLNLGLAGLKLDNSALNINSEVVFMGKDMNATAQGVFSQTQFSSKDRTVLAKEMVLALTNVNTFLVDAKAKGPLTDPKISIKSDLDNKLKVAFNKRIKQKQNELEKKLREKLADKLLSYSGDYEKEIRKMNASEGGLSGQLRSMAKMEKTELSDYKSQLKQEAKARADKKKAEAEKKKAAAIKKAKADADRKKAEAIKKAKADADKKKDAALKKAKEKLKNLF
jgi:uncharacterized protein (TIGR03545 family)